MATGDLYEVICAAGRDRTKCPYRLQGYHCTECNNARYLKRERTIVKEKETKEEVEENEPK